MNNTAKHHTHPTRIQNVLVFKDIWYLFYVLSEISSSPMSCCLVLVIKIAIQLTKFRERREGDGGRDESNIYFYNSSSYSLPLVLLVLQISKGDLELWMLPLFLPRYRRWRLRHSLPPIPCWPMWAPLTTHASGFLQIFWFWLHAKMIEVLGVP